MRNHLNLGLFALAVLPLAHAQDTRTVTEPTFPAVCTTLPAALTLSAGEPSSETAFDTARIQAALNSCPTGQAVELAASAGNNAFLLQPLTIPTGRNLIVDGGVTVFASRNPADYQNGTPSSTVDTCGTLGTHSNGCLPLIQIGSPTAATTNIGIFGYGVINGRGGDKLLVNGVASSQSWWDISASKSSSATTQNNPILIANNKSTNFTLYKISVISAPLFHVTFKNSSGFTAWGVKLATPFNAYNTDGLQTGQSSNVTATQSWISEGDDNFVATATPTGASANLTFSNSHVGSGHGASVSPAGGNVSNMLVTGISFTGQAQDTNAEAIHIKGEVGLGGTDTNIAYQNICIQNNHHPIRIDPFYATTSGTAEPLFQNITLSNIHVLTEGQFGLQGYDSAHLTTVTFDNLVFDNLNSNDITPAPQDTTIALGPGEVYPALLASITGTGVSYTGSTTVSNANAYPCTNAFPLIQGELFATTAANSVGAPASASVTNPASFTLNAVVEPLYSQVSYTNPNDGTYTAAAPPTAQVNFLEGAATVGTASLAANGTLAAVTLTNATPGTHTYTAVYAGDTTYPAFPFGTLSVTVSAGAPTQLAFTKPPPSSVATGTAPGNVIVAIQDSLGETTTSTASVTLTVSGPAGYSQTYTATAVNGSATFAPSAFSTPGTYTYAATSTGLTATPSLAENVTATASTSAQQILFFPLANFPSGSAYQLSARTTSGLPVTYSVSGPASISGSTLTVSAPGPVAVTASSPAANGFAAAPAVVEKFTAQ